MAYKPRFGSKLREQVWKLECFAAYQAGRTDGSHPICCLCDLPVTPDQAWDRSHVGVPRALGGKSVGVGHRRCNQLDNVQVVTPMVAKADNVRKKFVGIKGPGLGPAPMQCGRRSRRTKTMSHGVQPRKTGAQKHREFLLKRYFFIDDIDGPIEVHS